MYSENSLMECLDLDLIIMSSKDFFVLQELVQEFDKLYLKKQVKIWFELKTGFKNK